VIRELLGENWDDPDATSLANTDVGKKRKKSKICHRCRA